MCIFSVVVIDSIPKRLLSLDMTPIYRTNYTGNIPSRFLFECLAWNINVLLENKL